MTYGNPFLVTPQNDITQGLGMLDKALQYRQQQQEQQQLQQQQLQAQQAQQQKQQQAQQAVSAAFKSGDSDAIAQAMVDHPQMAGALESAQNFKSAATKQSLVNSARDILLNPNDAEEILKKRIQTVHDAGGDASDSMAALQEYKQDPKGFMQNVKNVYATYDPKGFQAYQSAQPQQAEPMTPYQQGMLNINQQNANIRRLQLEQKALEDKAKEKTTSLNQQALQQKIKANKQNQAQLMQERKAGLTSAYTNATDTINLAKTIMNSKGLSGATGVSSIFPTIPGSDTAKTESLLDTLNSKTYLDSVQQMKGMGALSDAEGKKLSSAIASLNTNLSEKDFKSNLNTIIKITGRAQKKAASMMQNAGYSVPDVDNVYDDNKSYNAEQGSQDARMQAPEAAISYVRNNPGSLEEFKEKYGYAPSVAPLSAIEFVKNNPQYKSQFISKYGYAPEGM
ncbi:MAG: hypothetical protein ACYSOJ_05180 [Planctomycetota bacterium]|jgi:hypothetical protein